MKMKNKSLAALLLLLASPIALFAASRDNDGKIEAAAKASYNYRTVLDDRVKVKSNDGVVTLTGTVMDNDEKMLAEDTVGNLPGVTRVKNEIKVKSDHPERSDKWIALKIRSRLLTKADVSATATKVSAVNGVVTLTGTADNAAQKELTEIYAKEIDGVKMVRNEIVVQDMNRDRNTGDTTRAIGDRNVRDGDRNRTVRDGDRNSRDGNRETMGEKIDDASITSQLKYALLTQKSTSALKTKVKTNEGVVMITGEASSDAEKSLVTKLAQTVRGVRSVNNEMTVRN